MFTRKQLLGFTMAVVLIITLFFSTPVYTAPPAPDRPARSVLNGVTTPSDAIRAPDTGTPASQTVDAADVVVQANGVYTWTQDTQADWEQGVPDNLDSTTISGSLQLEPRWFTENTTITPREELDSGQSDPDIVADADGNLYAVWSDMRNGNSDIYFAMRPAGGSWSTNEKVNDDSGSAVQSFPAIAIDAAGNIYAIWQDARNGNDDIYFAMRPAQGFWGPNIKINDDFLTSKQGSPAIAVDDAGSVYAIWTDERNGNADIYSATRPAGEAWGPNLRVNDDGGTATQGASDIVVGDSGDAYAIWSDSRNGHNTDIYFAAWSDDGLWDSNVLISDETDQAWKGWLALAVDNANNIYVTWTKNSASDYGDVYFTTKPSGGTWASPIKVNDDGGTGTQRGRGLAVDGEGNVYIGWGDDRDDVGLYWRFYLAHRSADGTWGPNTKVTNNLMWLTTPILATDATGALHAIWEDERNAHNSNYKGDIYQASQSLGGVWSASVSVNDDNTIGQVSPNLTSDSAGNTYAIWTESRNDVLSEGGLDVFVAHRSGSINWSNTTKINDDPGTIFQREPDIAVDNSGNLYAVWSDFRNDNYDIYSGIQPIGGTWGVNYKVNDDVGTAMQFMPALAVDEVGNAYALWTDWRNGDSDIYFAYRPSGGNWQANIRVNTDSGTESQSHPDIVVDSDANLYAVWRDGQDEVYFATRPVGDIWGAALKISGDLGIERWNWRPVLTIDALRNIYVVWADVYNNDIYFARRAVDGTWHSDIKVNDDNGSVNKDSPAVTVNSTGSVGVVWEDGRHGAPNLYFTQSLDAPVYVPQGTYTSPELNTGVSIAAWDVLVYSATLPADTSFIFETRSRPAGGIWSAWSPVESGEIASPPAQFLQYRAVFSSTSESASPLLDWVKVTYHSAGTPSAPRFITPCGVTNQTHPTLEGVAAAGSVIHLSVDGTEVSTTTVETDGTFSLTPDLTAGAHTLSVVAENASGQGPDSTSLALTVEPTLPYDPIGVRAGEWSKDGWLLGPPRDSEGCADPTNAWRVWPRENQQFRVEVPVTYTTSAAVTVTVGTQALRLTEEVTGTFVGVFESPIQTGDFTIEVETDGATTTVNGGPVLIDPDGFVYAATGTLSDTIPGVKVTCYYSDTHAGEWVMWDAWNYNAQVNSQTTLEDGYYSFYTPSGTYRVVAEKEGYPTYTSPDLVVVDTPVRHNIPLGSYKIYLPLVLR